MDTFLNTKLVYKKRVLGWSKNWETLAPCSNKIEKVSNLLAHSLVILNDFCLEKIVACDYFSVYIL